MENLALNGNLTTPLPGNETVSVGQAGLQHGTAAVVVPIVFSLVFFVGVIGNGTLIYTVLWNKSMRNIPNIFIVSLACGDFLLILISVPFSATIYTFTGWPYGLSMCKFNNYMQTLSLGVSVFTLTALSGERFMIILRPMSKHRGNPKAVTIVITAIIWILSAILAIPDAATPYLMEYETTHTTDVLDFCRLYNESALPEWYPRSHVMAKFVIFYALPVWVIAGFYIVMAITLLHSSRHMPGEQHAKAQQQKQIEARKKVAVVVLCLVIIFLLCWLPRHVYLIWYYYDPSEYNEFWHVFKIFGFCLSFVNSSVNPLALYFLSRQFRRYYNRYLFCCCSKLRYRSVESSSSVMYNFNSTIRRTSTSMTMVQSQSM